jgi:hypothetical protein
VKASPLVYFTLLCAVAVHAQGTIEFDATLAGSSEVPPNNDPTTCIGQCWLTGDSLSFLVNVPAVTFTPDNAYIQGPGLAGANGPIIFDLGGSVFHAGSEFGIPPYYAFFSPPSGPAGAGPFTLTANQINELESGEWYINVTSFTSPDGQLRGQLTETPEPAVVALLGLSAVVMVLFRKTKTKTL